MALGNLEGRVRLCYANEQGCREDVIAIAEALDKKNGFQPDALLKRTVAKALSLLGSQGWELVSVAPSPTDNLHWQYLYLKRRLP